MLVYRGIEHLLLVDFVVDVFNIVGCSDFTRTARRLRILMDSSSDNVGV